VSISWVVLLVRSSSDQPLLKSHNQRISRNIVSRKRYRSISLTIRKRSFLIVNLSIWTLHRNISARRAHKRKIQILFLCKSIPSYPLSLLKNWSDQPLLRFDNRRVSQNFVSRKRVSVCLMLRIALYALRILGARHYRASW